MVSSYFNLTECVPNNIFLMDMGNVSSSCFKHPKIFQFFEPWNYWLKNLDLITYFAVWVWAKILLPWQLWFCHCENCFGVMLLATESHLLGGLYYSTESIFLSRYRVGVLFLCSYITLPLYALITQVLLPNTHWKFPRVVVISSPPAHPQIKRIKCM